MANWCSNTIEIKGNEEDIAKVKALLINDENEVDFSIVEPIPLAIKGVVITTADNKFSLNKCIDNRAGRLNPDDFIARIAELYKEHDIDALKAPNLKELIELEPFFNAETSIEESIELSVNNKIKEKNEEITEHTNWQQYYTPMIKAIMEVIDVEWQLNCADRYGSSGWYLWSTTNWGVKYNACDTGVFNVYQEDGTIAKDTLNYFFSTPWSPPSEWFETFLNRIDGIEGINVEIKLTYAESGIWFGGTITRSTSGKVLTLGLSNKEIAEFLNIDEDFDQCFDEDDECFDEDENSIHVSGDSE